MIETKHTLRRAALLLASLAAALSLAACDPRQDYRGYAFDDSKFNQIKPGVQTRNQVVQLLGTPSSVATFKDHNDTWYYIAKETETLAFLPPDVKSQKIIAIDFDNEGKVRDVRNYALKDGRDVSPDPNETPTSGREFGFFEQLFGNIGRFNGAGGGPGGAGGPGQ
ncbi:MAG TPA: outer membrane protein assembly factor BamE [Candidatus Cybelea sp.]|nr:outer membrane protein assembly factor BamE [Candidatus Cybelea sp.]